MMSEADLVATIKACGGTITVYQPNMRLLWTPSPDGAEKIFARNNGWSPVAYGSRDQVEIDLLAPRRPQET